MHAIAVAMLAVVIAAPAAAANKCAGNKIKATGKKAYCLLAREAKEAANGTLDAVAVQKCRDKFSATFVKSEATLSCLTVGDDATIEGKVDAFVADVDGRLSPPPSTISDCQAHKITASGRKAKCLLGLAGKAAAKGAPTDPLRVMKCETKLTDAFADADARDDCTTTGDGADLEDVVDAFVYDVVDELGGSPSGAFVEPVP
jgi:hypothetical protein